MAAAVPRFDTRIVAPLTKFSDETSLFGIWRAAISCRHEIIRKSNFKHVLVSTLFRGPGSSSLLWVVLDQITRQPLHRIVRTDLDKLGHAFKCIGKCIRRLIRFDSFDGFASPTHRCGSAKEDKTSTKVENMSIWNESTTRERLQNNAGIKTHSTPCIYGKKQHQTPAVKLSHNSPSRRMGTTVWSR